MILIPDNATLRSFIPNTFSQQFEDSETLYDKMAPHLRSAELWLTETLIPEPILHRIVEETQDSGDALYFVPRNTEALRAWISAVPSLDVVVSDNGISTVETQTLRPASKAKIDRLLEATLRQLDDMLEQLPGLLRRFRGWWSSPQSMPFRRTVFDDYSVLRSLRPQVPTAEPGHGIVTVHERFVGVLPSLEAIEDEIAEYWVSHPVMARLRNLPPECRDGIDLSNPVMRLLLMCRSAVVDIYNGTSPERKKMLLRRLSDFVISHPEAIPEWRGSSTARLFSVASYRNKQDASAHWL